jgi:hypothetical protein
MRRWLIIISVSCGCSSPDTLVSDVEIVVDGGSAQLTITATDGDGNPVTDAEITVSGDGGPAVPVGYTATLSAAAAFDVELAWHGNLVRRHLVTPPDVTVSIAPDPPTRGAAAQVSWTSADATLTACVDVMATHVCGVDMGHANLPATTFPTAGPYDVKVSRTSGVPGTAAVTRATHVPETVN